jgi:hypothetical protein
VTYLTGTSYSWVGLVGTRSCKFNFESFNQVQSLKLVYSEGLSSRKISREPLLSNSYISVYLAGSLQSIDSSIVHARDHSNPVMYVMAVLLLESGRKRCFFGTIYKVLSVKNDIMTTDAILV